MPTTTYTTVSQRLGIALGEMLKAAEHVEVLSLGCKMKEMPRNKGDSITYRRYLPFGATSTNANTQNRPAATASAHIVAEGVTPAADTLTPVDVNVVQQQYACLYAYTDKTQLFHEDDIPKEEQNQAARRMGLVHEMIRYGGLKGCTNVLYSGGTTRATVDEAISLNALRRMTRTLKLNHAEKKTQILAPGPDYNTFAVEAAYIVFVSTDCEPDIRDLAKFTPVAEYANRKPISPHELGTCEEFRFITSPELTAYANAATSITASTAGLVSTGSTYPDVYPFLVMGEEACFDVAPKLVNGSSRKPIDVIHNPINQPSKSDPLNQRGYVGAKFWAACKVVNSGFMGIIEAGTRTLT